MKTIILILATTTLLTSCGLFRNYTTITTKPENYFSNTVVHQDTSLISFDLKVDYKSIEQKVNELFSEPITDSESGEFDKQYTAKTKNIAYDPVEWIKTKDPFYQPNKWYKTKIFGKWIKTKDRSYHPRKWIKTKNPKYDPNKWIYAKTVRVEVGYKYDYSIQKRQNIKFENINSNVLRIKIPIDVEGSVGFNGDGAKLLSLNKKNVKTKVDFFIDSEISFDPDWCPVVKSKINHKWVSDPKIEIAGGAWLNLKLPAELGLNEIENEIENEIAKSIDCGKLTNEIKKWIKPSSIKLTNLTDNLYLNLNPQNFYISDLLVNKSELNIKFGSKVIIGVGTQKLFENDNSKLPKLEEYTFKENLIALTVPVSIEYKSLENILNNKLEKESLKYEENKTKVEVLEFEMYPSGEEVSVGIKLSAKIPGRILSTKGKVYLTAKPIVKNKKFELENISFSTELDNELYPIIGAIFKEKIINYIHSSTQKSLKKDFEKAELIIETKVKEQLQNINNIDVKTKKITLDIPYISIKEKEFTIPVRLVSGVEIKVKNIW